MASGEINRTHQALGEAVQTLSGAVVGTVHRAGTNANLAFREHVLGPLVGWVIGAARPIDLRRTHPEEYARKIDSDPNIDSDHPFRMGQIGGLRGGTTVVNRSFRVVGQRSAEVVRSYREHADTLRRQAWQDLRRVGHRTMGYFHDNMAEGANIDGAREERRHAAKMARITARAETHRTKQATHDGIADQLERT